MIACSLSRSPRSSNLRCGPDTKKSTFHCDFETCFEVSWCQLVGQYIEANAMYQKEGVEFAAEVQRIRAKWSFAKKALPGYPSIHRSRRDEDANDSE